MARASRRAFLGEVGSGMLLAGLGTALAADLGIRTADGADEVATLDFGELEPLVSRMQESSPHELLGSLARDLAAGTELKTLVAAGLLANARTFGGQDYIGFHTFMALAPAYRMAQELPASQRPLPVLKVLYRNTQRIQEFGGRAHEVLHPIAADPIPVGAVPGEHVRALARTGDVDKAERAFASLADLPLGEAFHHAMFEVQEEVDVHRVVLAWRAWDSCEFTGESWAHCLLRQSIRYGATTEQRIAGRVSPVRTAVPKLLDQYQLLGRPLGSKSGDDVWMKELATTLFRGSRDQAADAVAQSLRDGFAPDAIAEALSIAANWLVLHDPGRPAEWSSLEKPPGSVHGDSVGVHASDAANAWRNIVRVSNPRNVITSLLVGAYHTGGQSDRSTPLPYPFAEHLAEIQESDAPAWLQELDAAIRDKNQLRAAALMARYQAQGHASRAAIDLLLKYAVSEDGALHAEKYYHTVAQEFQATRPTFRAGQLVALARVTASEYGRRSAGYEEGLRRLGT